MKIKGGCLCGGVRFEIEADALGIYQCHCSECRKVTGSAADSSCLVPSDRFRWLSGSADIRSYVHGSGHRSDFCPNCGSPTPNEFKGKPYYWIPAGALENTSFPELKAHIYVGSKAEWDRLPEVGVRYAEVPPLDELFEVLGGV